MISNTNHKYKHYLLLLLGLFIFITPSEGQKLPGNIRLPMGGGSGGGGGARGGAVLDDSTKNIYGPKTTAYFFEDDILNNRDSARNHIDTSLAYFHRWNPIDRAWGQIVDLGNLGTANRPLFFEPRNEVGRQLGFRAYDLYDWQESDIRYYDTKSPYTDMYFVMGGHDRDILRFAFTQNVNPRFNVGFKFTRTVSQRQYGSYAARGAAAALARNWNFMLHGSYFSKNKKYALLTHFRRMSHSAREQGGVILKDTVQYVITGDDYEGPARLSNTARDLEMRNAIRIYQQYKLVNGFQLFQQLELRASSNRYQDSEVDLGIENGIYTPIIEVGRVLPINQKISSKLLDNKIGIKGTLGGYTYRAYFRTRLQDMQGQYYLNDSTRADYGMSRFEPIIGGWMQYHLPDSTWKLTASGEHVLARDLVLKGKLDSPIAQLGFQTALTSPDLLMHQYKNAYAYWNNTDSLKLSKTITFTAALPIKSNQFTFTPEFQWNQIINYLYYDENARPAQDGGTFSIMRVGFDASANLKRWKARIHSYYTEGFDNDIIRIPRIYASGEVAYAFTYAKAMDIELGLTGYYTSAYYANAYAPMIQQFYIQNDLKVGNYPVVDVFANIRIKRALLLLKYSHLNNSIGKEGYFLTPHYMGLKPAFSFGVNWPLFD